MNKTKRSVFERINKVNKPLARLTKKKKERTQINKIRKAREELTIGTMEIQRTIRHYVEPTNWLVT